MENLQNAVMENSLAVDINEKDDFSQTETCINSDDECMRLQRLLIVSRPGYNREIRNEIQGKKIFPGKIEVLYKKVPRLPIRKTKPLKKETQDFIIGRGEKQRSVNDLLDHVMDRVLIKKIDDTFWYYDEPIWRHLDSAETLYKIMCGRIKHYDSISIQVAKEMYDTLMGRSMQMKNTCSAKVKNQYLVCFRSGIYDIKKNKLYPHSPRYYFFNFLDFDFVPGVIGNGRVFDQYLESICLGDERVRERVLQVIGYVISELENVKKIPLFVGERDSGKTTLVNLLSEIVGYENREAISLEDMNRYSTSRLINKKIGVCSDLSGKKIPSASVERLKLLTGGDPIRAEGKFENATTFMPTCRFIIASNFIPRTETYDSALEERFLLVPFRKSIPKEEKNPQLLNEILDGSVMQHVFSLVFEALRRFIDNDMQFADIGELEYYNPNTDIGGIHDFFKEQCVYELGYKTKTANIYPAYERSCKKKKRKPFSKKEFNAVMRPLLEEEGYKEDKNGTRGYKNLRILEEELYG